MYLSAESVSCHAIVRLVVEISDRSIGIGTCTGGTAGGIGHVVYTITNIAVALAFALATGAETRASIVTVHHLSFCTIIAVAVAVGYASII